MVQNCTLDDSCGYLGDLCVSVVLSWNARFQHSLKHTTAKWLLYCFRTCQTRATCIPCRSAATVDEFRGGIFTPRSGLLHPLIRYSPSSLRSPHELSAAALPPSSQFSSILLGFKCLGLHYVMGGGWDLCKRIRGDRYRGNHM